MNASFPSNMPPDFNAALGALMAKPRLEVEDMKLMILVETAGDPLYQKLAELAPEGEARDLLLQNAREETAHAHRLKKAIEILTTEPYEIPALSENPYSAPPPIPGLTQELLAAVQAAEKSGDACYQQYADNETNGEVAAFLRQNGREETRHGERVERVAEILGAASEA